MAYSKTINLVTGDTLPELTLTLKDSNTAASGQILDGEDSNTWSPIDVTGATVRLRIRTLGSSVIKSTLYPLISLQGLWMPQEPTRPR